MSGACGQARRNPLDNLGARHGVVDYLIGFLFLLFLAAIALPLTSMLAPRRHIPLPGSSAVRVGRSDDLPAGQGTFFLLGERPFLAVRTRDGFRGFSAICPLGDAVLEWDARRGVVACPVHGEAFDLRGNVLLGPSGRPLATVDLTVRGGEVLAREASP